MKKNNPHRLPKITIQPGESYVTQKNEIISTLLGSCVAACLYDPINRIIGMNHFLLAQQPCRQSTTILGSDEGRFGIHAMELLINKMLKIGARRIFLKAKAFGGGDVLKMAHELRGNQSVGACNCEFIKTFLATEGIPLVASDLGGNKGRNIFFLATDFSVYIKPIASENQQAIINEEQRFLQNRSIPQQTSTLIQQADFW